eukprot:scaffold48960_cov49-Phaeocystis_antarctica.AAC.1
MGPSRKFCGGIEAVDVGVRQGSGSARPGAGRRLTSSRISSAFGAEDRQTDIGRLVYISSNSREEFGVVLLLTPASHHDAPRVPTLAVTEGDPRPRATAPGLPHPNR